MITSKLRLTQLSLLVTIALVIIKALASWLSGSISIFAEAMNNASDVITSLIAWVAVRISAKPADTNHPFGHGKIESLGSLMTIGFFVATYVWVIYQAILRILSPHSFENWLFPTLAVALGIIVNIFRQHWFAKGSVKYKSQTLATEALNFRTDILASLVALSAILVTSLTSFWFADSVGAIIVSIIALIFAVKLAKHAINVLLDYAPEEWVTKVRQIATTTQNVLEVNNVRVREVGTNLYIDLTVRVARSLSFEQSHDIATEIEHKVHALSHDVDIVVHIEPIATDDESLIDRIRASASRSGKAIHNIHVYTIADQVYAQLDLEVNPNLDLQQAHGLSQELELILRKEFALAHVSIHIEPNTFLEHGSKQKLQQHLEKSNIGRSVERIARHNRDVQRVHNLVLDQVGDEINLSLDCELNPMMSLESAHIIAEKFERELRVKLPKLARVSIHTEPQGAEDL